MQREDFEVPLTSAPLPRHMLFLGTKEYPEENSFESFLVANSGSQNAFTSAAWLKDAGSNRSSVRQLVEHFRSSCAVMLWWYVMDEAGSLLASVCLSFFLSLSLSLSRSLSVAPPFLSPCLSVVRRPTRMNLLNVSAVLSGAEAETVRLCSLRQGIEHNLLL